MIPLFLLLFLVASFIIAFFGVGLDEYLKYKTVIWKIKNNKRYLNIKKYHINTLFIGLYLIVAILSLFFLSSYYLDHFVLEHAQKVNNLILH